MTIPVEMDRLWALVAEAEEASKRGTELIGELRRLLARGDTFSGAWLEDRRKVRQLIEAHLAAVGEVKARLRDTRLQSNETGASQSSLPSNVAVG